MTSHAISFTLNDEDWQRFVAWFASGNDGRKPTKKDAAYWAERFMKEHIWTAVVGDEEEDEWLAGAM